MKTLIFVPVQFQASANQAAATMQHATDGTTGGEFTFTVPLFALAANDDSSPIGYWCAVGLTPANRAQVDTLLTQFPGAQVWDYDADSHPEFPQSKLAELSLRTANGNPRT